MEAGGVGQNVMIPDLTDSDTYLTDSEQSDTDSEYWEMPCKESDEDQIYKFRLFHLTEERTHPGRDGKRPKDRSGHRIVYHKGRIFSFGGYNPDIDLDDEDLENDDFWPESKPLFKELWELNIFSKRWHKTAMKGNIPEQLASHTAVSHPLEPGTMIVYGGTGAPFGLTTSNTVAACRLDSADWRRVPANSDGQYPEPLYGQAVVVDKEKGQFYTVGGTSGFHYFMDIHRLDLTQSPPVWTRLYQPGGDDEPRARYRHELCLYDDKILVMGGGTSYMAEGFHHLPTFCLKENSWTYTKTMPDTSATIDVGDGGGYPDKRRCHGVVQSGTEVFIFGGYDGSEVYGDLWKLDLLAMKWAKIPAEMPLPVYFQASTITEEGKLFIFGGVDNVEANTRTNRVFSGWLKIPSLRSLCWEAVTHYIPDIGNVEPSRLVEEGVPRDCVNMLTSQQAECG